jgi:hypothetical protein
MENQSVLLYVSMILAALLSCIAAWIIAWRYRKRMKFLMRAAQQLASDATGAAVALPEPAASAPVTLAGNRAAGLRLTLLLIAISMLIAFTSAWIWWALSFPGEPFHPKRVAIIWMLHLWPVIPALALVWRWSRKQLFGALLAWCLLCFFIFIWRQIEYRPMEALAVIASEVGLAMVLVSLVFLGNAARAIAPWLMVPLALLIWAALSGLQVMMFMGEHHLALFAPVAKVFDPLFGDYALVVLMTLFLLVPVVVAWWPARALGRAFGRAYSSKWFTDLLVLFTAVWGFALLDRALTTAAGGAGAAAFAMLIPLLWIPAVMCTARFWSQRVGPPPTLLVLRVFQQDQQTQRLYDQVIERWRLSGNTVTIAGTDLADRTLDAGDIFEFLDRRLAARFIMNPADVPRRIAEFDLDADIDGRFRVNECYCHDSTWQAALTTLVRRSDVVLMDLRGFQAKNAGSLFELSTLAAEARELRVVLLTDERTDRKTALDAVSHGPVNRFKWIEATRLDARKRREVLASLFGTADQHPGVATNTRAAGALP